MDLDKLRQKYYDTMHAMQTGVAYLMNYDPKETDPKHLRTGVNSALIDSGALMKLLIEKGIVTEQEVYETLIEFAERDVESYMKRIQEVIGPDVKITLG